MDRKSFIKSIAMLIAAPKIIGELEVLKQETPTTAIDFADTSSVFSYTKIACWFKISTEMEKDSEYIEYLFNDKSSFLWRNCKRAGIDLNNPFEFNLGFAEDDFTRGLKTGIITQMIPV